MGDVIAFRRGRLTGFLPAMGEAEARPEQPLRLSTPIITDDIRQIHTPPTLDQASVITPEP